MVRSALEVIHWGGSTVCDALTVLPQTCHMQVLEPSLKYSNLILQREKPLEVKSRYSYKKGYRALAFYYMIFLLKVSMVKCDEVLEGAVLCPEGLPGVLWVSKPL